jgi:hypothetical protein
MRPTKTYEYIVVLKKSSTKVIDIISLLMLAISTAFFSYDFALQFKAAGNVINSTNTLLLVWIFGIIGWLLFCRNQQRRGLTPHYRFALMLAAWGWFMHPAAMWLAAVFLLAAFLEKPLKVVPEYAFDDHEIAFNSFPQKKYSWSDVNNVVLKDGLLTIDFKTNKMVQGEVNDDVSVQLEKEFNDYCKGRLIPTTASNPSLM